MKKLTDIEKIQAEVEQLQQNNAELTADLQRIQADFVNFRRRGEEEKGEFMTMAKRDVIGAVLPLLDNIDRALAHQPDDLADHAWAKGVAAVAKQAEGTLAGLGITKIEAVGQPFDPNLHEAISFEDGDGEGEVVIEELQPGYMLGDRILRPAVVKVGKQ